MDERLATGIARRMGLAVLGTLGVLVQAARRKLIEIDPALVRLQDTNFFATENVLQLARRMAAQPDANA
jgi:predicted nucleic acid-binding protein